jgi:hypothetical protein
VQQGLSLNAAAAMRELPSGMLDEAHVTRATDR